MHPQPLWEKHSEVVLAIGVHFPARFGVGIVGCLFRCTAVTPTSVPICASYLGVEPRLAFEARRGTNAWLLAQGRVALAATLLVYVVL